MAPSPGGNNAPGSLPSYGSAPPPTAMLQETSLSLTRVLEQHTDQVRNEYEAKLNQQKADMVRELDLHDRKHIGHIEEKEGTFREAMLVRVEIV
jgi:hypothetical protein